VRYRSVYDFTIGQLSYLGEILFSIRLYHWSVIISRWDIIQYRTLPLVSYHI